MFFLIFCNHYHHYPHYHFISLQPVKSFRLIYESHNEIVFLFSIGAVYLTTKLNSMQIG